MATRHDGADELYRAPTDEDYDRGDDMSNGPEEPTADMRQLASTLRDMYVALTLEGFTSAEALTIIGHAIAGQGGRA